MSRSKTKLVSAVMGISLIVEQDGEQRKVEYTMRTHEGILGQPLDCMREMATFINEHLGTDLEVVYEECGNVQFAKPKRIKARSKVTQKQFNKRIAELGG